jgi:hypothetical protein
VVLVGAAVRDGDRRTISVLCCTPRDGVVVPYAKQSTAANGRMANFDAYRPQGSKT